MTRRDSGVPPRRRRRESQQADGQSLPALAGPLLRWFARQARPLPWRRNRDPYCIWISEVMLQQTTAAAVVPRFRRFLIRFPTVRHLAQAELHEVLAHWEGLGYYRRAVHLHQAARLIVERFGGHWPNDPEAWSELPGVGRYIRNAVLSQAFNQRLPIVEANSRRVLCRLFGHAGPAGSAAAERWLWRTAEAILPCRRVGDFNQALMELGALVCTPRRPRCPECPLAPVCQARRSGHPESFPQPARKPVVQVVEEVCLIPRYRGRFLLVRRPASGRWPHLWEFPRAPVARKEGLAEAARRLLAELGLAGRIADEIAQIRYAVTHHRITMHCYLVALRTNRMAQTVTTERHWVGRGEWDSFPLSSPQRRLTRALTRWLAVEDGA